MEPIKRAVTMSDVAKHARVSLSTVSHALSGKRPVSQETKARIMDAIAELDWSPNELARRLANQKSAIIGVHFPHYARGFSQMQMEFMSGAVNAADRGGYSLLICSSEVRDENILSFARGGLVEGLILMETRHNDPRMRELAETEFPFSVIGRAESDRIRFVDLDFERAVFDAFEHLVSLGHRSIGFIDYPGTLVSSGYNPSAYSCRGLERAVAELDLPKLYTTCGGTPADGHRAIDRLFATRPGLSAVVTANEMALPGMYRGVLERQLSIPDDFSFVGIVSEERAETFHPRLNGIDFPAARMGQRGVEILIDALRDRPSHAGGEILTGKLCRRESSGKPVS